MVNIMIFCGWIGQYMGSKRGFKQSVWRRHFHLFTSFLRPERNVRPGKGLSFVSICDGGKKINICYGLHCVLDRRKLVKRWKCRRQTDCLNPRIYISLIVSHGWSANKHPKVVNRQSITTPVLSSNRPFGRSCTKTTTIPTRPGATNDRVSSSYWKNQAE